MNKEQKERRANIYVFVFKRLRFKRNTTIKWVDDANYLMRQNHALRNIGLRLCNENMTEEEKERLKRKEKTSANGVRRWQATIIADSIIRPTQEAPPFT